MKEAGSRLLPLAAMLALAGIVAQPPVVAAASAPVKSAMKTVANQQNGNATVKHSVAAAASKAAEQGRSTVIKEAVTALADVDKALILLDKGKKKEALDALAEATGKLELVVARDPSLTLAPVAVHVTAKDLIASVDTIDEAVERARKYLSDGEVQKARVVLANLASELVVTVTNIPLGTFPAAIKAVSPLIDQGKIGEAKAALVTALSTLVDVDTVIPLPVLRAELLLEKAEALAEKRDRSDAQDESLAILLSQARYQLKIAKALGYGKKSDFRDYYRMIDEIQEKTHNGGFGTGFFDKIKAKLKALTETNAKASGSPSVQHPKK